MLFLLMAFRGLSFSLNPIVLCDLSPLLPILHHRRFHSRCVVTFDLSNHHLHLDLVWFSGLALLVLDSSSYARSNIDRALPPSSLALRLPIVFFCSLSLTSSPMLVIFGFGVMFLLFKLLRCLVWLLLDLYLLFLMFPVFVFGLVLVTLYASVPSTDFNSTISASITIQWSLLVHSKGSDFFYALWLMLPPCAAL
jgi:hypothetical protein